MMRMIQAAGTAVVAAALSAATLPAQNLTLIHGFASDSTTWIGTDSHLRTRFPTHPVFPLNYTWQYSILGASQTLTVSSPSNSILIGHSLGGVVSRKYAQSNPVVGIVTMGSPNLGANLAGNYGHIVSHLGYTAGRAYQVNQKLWALNLPYWSTLIADIDYWGNNAVALLFSLPTLLDYAVGIAVPIVYDLEPASAAMAQVNATGLGLEMANAPVRASLAFAEPAYPQAPAWRLAMGNTLGNTADFAMQALQALSITAYYTAQSQEPDAMWEYDSSRYYALLDLEFESGELATSLGDLNWHWCFSVSVRPANYWYAPVSSCFPNDLFISTADMLAPGAFLHTGQASSHTEETQRATDIESVLVNRFGLP